MEDLDHTKIQVKNFKCFGEKPAGFDSVKPLNVIVGRNNTGKSTLLDLIEYVIKPSDLAKYGHRRKHTPAALITESLKEEQLRAVFRDSRGAGDVDRRESDGWGEWVNTSFTYELLPDDRQFVYADGPKVVQGEHFNVLAKNHTRPPLQKREFRRLAADRDIRPESENEAPGISPDGCGTTSLICRCLKHEACPSELVETTLLNELNKVYGPDSRFTRIMGQQRADDRWEVFLDEDGKGRVPLSQSGSGLKTVLMVLSLLFLEPERIGRKIEDFVFGLEELENNLHPALQRRLFMYLKSFAQNRSCVFFITSHSSVAIDLFCHDEDAQLVHVTHTGKFATAEAVTTWASASGVVDDLGARASDILQANGVVWVEGPSDRLYFNRWVQLFTNGDIVEGIHYQCVFYGGRLLSHFAADPEIKASQAIDLLRVNRNSIMLIDSDKSSHDGDLNSTKTRIVKEITDVGGIGWVTAGREIENYIPTAALELALEKRVERAVGRYEKFPAFLDEIIEGEGAAFLRNKVDFAKRICKKLRLDHLHTVYDLKERMEEVCNTIYEWNS